MLSGCPAAASAARTRSTESLMIRPSIPSGQCTAGAAVGSADIALRCNLDGIRRSARRARHYIVPARLQGGNLIGRKAGFDRYLVRLPLMMQARRLDRLVDRHVEIDDVDD